MTGFVFLVLVLLIAIAWCIEVLIERIARKRYPSPGELIDVGGYRLHLHALGERYLGQPTVLFESGDGAWSTYWGKVQLEVARFARACTYDRAGFGWSDSSPAACTLEQIARELHSLLKNADESGPYLLVGHSFGGTLIRQYANQYPEDVASVVLIDALHENIFQYMPALQKDVSAYWVFLRLMGMLAHIGIPRLFRRALLSRYTSIARTQEEKTLLAAQALQPKYFCSLLRENIAFDRARKHGQIPPSLGNIPLTVIHAHYSEEPQPSFKPPQWQKFRESWMAIEKDLINLSPHSQLVTVDSGHIIQNEHPEIIVQAVKQLLEGEQQV